MKFYFAFVLLVTFLCACALAFGQTQEVPLVVAPTSSDFVITVVTSVVALIGTIFTGVMAYLMAKLNNKAATAETNRVEVATKLQSTTQQAVVKADETLAVANTIHTLVNNNMHVALAATAVMAQRIADITQLPADVEQARKSAQAVTDHDKGQATVDALKGAAPAMNA